MGRGFRAFRSFPSSDSDLGDFPKAKHQRRLPVVLTKDEVKRLFSHLDGQPLLMARLLYGTGLRLTEMLSLRVKDIDFASGTVHVRQGKGGKDRVTILPENLVDPLRAQLASVVIAKYVCKIREESFSTSRREEGVERAQRPTSNAEGGKEARDF